MQESHFITFSINVVKQHLNNIKNNCSQIKTIYLCLINISLIKIIDVRLNLKVAFTNCPYQNCQKLIVQKHRLRLVLPFVLVAETFLSLRE